MLLKSNTRHYSEGSIVADSSEQAQGLMVIVSGYVTVELPMDSEEADEENRTDDGRTVLYVFGRGYASQNYQFGHSTCTVMQASLSWKRDDEGHSDDLLKSAFS